MNDSSRNRAVVIYDGECSFCRKQTQKIRRRDKQQRFELIPSQSPELTTRFPQLAEHDLQSGMRLIDERGEVHVGADAVYEIARRLPGHRWFAWCYRLPGVRGLARTAYAWIARHRHRL
jgi:predicted DCC family thiol-disulfide oxidoreductase YuxK